MISDYMYEMLHNWARWATYGSGVGGRCRSIEHRYVPESDIEKRVSSSIPVNNADAVRVEKALVDKAMPKKSKAIIIGKFAYRQSDVYCARSNGISMAKFDDEMAKAVKIVENRIKLK